METKIIAACTALAVLALAPAAHAGRIVIPVFQNQSAVNYGTQNQGAGGYGGNTTQSAGLEQVNAQSQTVNVYVPDDFRGKVQTTYVNRPENRPANFSGRSFERRRDGRGAYERFR